jgi:hypothetical protein
MDSKTDSGSGAMRLDYLGIVPHTGCGKQPRLGWPKRERRSGKSVPLRSPNIKGVSRYTKAASQRLLATSGMTKLTGNKIVPLKASESVPPTKAEGKSK